MAPGAEDVTGVGDAHGVDRDKLRAVLSAAVFTGALYGHQLATVHASMDIFVHPGEHETVCQTVQEALVSGVPVIAPDAGGPRDLVTPFRTRLLLPVDKFESRLGQSIDHLIGQRPRYAQAARRSVLGRTWPATCDRLIDDYVEVQANGRGRAAETRST